MTSESQGDFDPFLPKNDPFSLFSAWFDDAVKSEPADPNAMTLATVDSDGRPSARVVLLKGFDGDGFVFYTNTESRKGDALAANPVAALCFHWKSRQRQVRIEGAITPVTDAEADTYFASRPRGSRIGAWASNQSRPLAAHADLVTRVAEMEARFPGETVERPPHWSGYRLAPDQIEFWQAGEFRIHDRLVYRRTDVRSPWTSQVFQP